jgi:pimeloyl-ACP methyl ester carboxylesterase
MIATKEPALVRRMILAGTGPAGPVLVANREDDRMLPTRSSFDLAHRLPNASLRIYPDAGHGGVFQCHEQFVPQVLKFLR